MADREPRKISARGKFRTYIGMLYGRLCARRDGESSVMLIPWSVRRSIAFSLTVSVILWLVLLAVIYALFAA